MVCRHWVDAGAGEGAGALWPAEPIGTAMLGALLTVFVGDAADASITKAERAELLSSLAGYRRRAFDCGLRL